MRRIALLSLAAAVAVAVAAPAAQADGADVTRTIEHDATQVLDFTNPCTGEEATATIEFHSVFVLTARPNNTFSLTSVVNGTFELVPDDPSSSVSTGRFVSTDVIGGGVNDVETSVLTAHGRTADGAQFSLVFVSHLNETGSGVTLSFDRCN